MKTSQALHRLDRILEENLNEIMSMFGLHFQNIFAPFPLLEEMHKVRWACGVVFPAKVGVFERNISYGDIERGFVFSTLSKMKNGKSHYLDGFPCEFYKIVWDTDNDDLFNQDPAREVVTIPLLGSL